MVKTEVYHGIWIILKEYEATTERNMYHLDQKT